MSEKKKEKDSSESIIKTIDQQVEKAQKALDAFMSYTQEEIDHICHEMALAGIRAHMPLAKMAVEETGRGVYEDKVIKNLFSTEYIWNTIRDEKTVGVIRHDELASMTEIAEPLGVIAGVTPVTNPTSTTMFKSIISIKARNPIIFGFHPSAQKCSAEAARILRDAAIEAGAPENCIQWIETPSLEATSTLMNHPGIALVLATGGSGMVASAYSTGKPALGVGPGNVPSYIHQSANLKEACTDIMLSKTFDNGMICASEQAVIVDEKIHKDFENFMKENSCYFVNAKETEKLENYMFPADKNHALNGTIVGQPAATIAKNAGFSVPEDTKILIVPLKKAGKDEPLSKEKLSPVLAYYVSKTTEEGVRKAEEILENGGLGHSASIHAKDQDVIDAYSNAVRVGRVLVNQPTSQGGIGDIYNSLTPSLTLGCGSYGHNSTTSNVTATNLINIKREADRRVNMLWFKVPPKVYFEEDSIQYLAKMPDANKVFIVTDPAMVEMGYVNRILYYLNQRREPCRFEIFSSVEPDPSIETLMRGVEAMENFKPDTIIALGGGSPMDAAKGMWLFYESPDFSFKDAHQKFLDIRKRAYRFPELGRKARMVSIPTTSGTGSEVTSFSVISDTANNIKYPLADYELTPDVAIIDPQFTMTMPKSITADTGLDVLTHAIESYVSIMASDYTEGLSLQAIKLVFNYLPRAVKNGASDPEARTKMHNASCIAGMAFTNAFLGINHSMAHKLGGEYHIAHGRANAILLPYVIHYNGSKPTKFPVFPNVSTYVADEKYAEIARMLGLPASTPAEGVESLAKAVTDLVKECGGPLSIEECGIDRKVFTDNLDLLANNSFGDQCTTANPRYPLVSELADILMDAYDGKAFK